MSLLATSSNLSDPTEKGHTATIGRPIDVHRIAIEEYKQLVKTGRGYFGFFVRSFFVYLAVLGVLLKLFFTSEASSFERLALFSAGLTINLGAIGITLVGRHYFLGLASRFREVSIVVAVPDVYYPPLISTASAFLGLNIVLCALWLALIVRI